nr:VIT1/CCC1 transporter family protein [Candidatus Sigynarchaeum springense]MDO8116204.1 VIT1/CCC1 transporter family protein [Candidatus Sigynarchaeota archaeon]
MAFQDKTHVQGGGIIREIVFGMNDGIVSIFALLAGIAGAGVGAQQILLTLLAATIAGALSMAAGEYLSSKSARNYIESEIHKERLEIKLCPDIEREEIHHIYKKKGFSGEVLDQIVATITKDPELWVKEMVVDELGTAEIEQESELKGVITIFGSFMAGAMFPTLPYMVLQILGGDVLFWVATFVTFFGLFLVGALKKVVTGQNWLKSGLEMLIAGTLAFLASYGIGLLVGVSV